MNSCTYKMKLKCVFIEHLLLTGAIETLTCLERKLNEIFAPIMVCLETFCGKGT